MIYILLLQVNLVVGILGPLDSSSNISCEKEIESIKRDVSNKKLLDRISFVCYYSNHKPNIGDLYPFEGGRK